MLLRVRHFNIQVWSVEEKNYIFSSEAAGIRHNGIYSVKCVRIHCRSKNITGLGSPQVFDEWILLQFFLHDTFYVHVRQRIQKFILYQILNLYPHIIFIHKELSIVQKLHVWCDSLNMIIFGINTN